MTSEKTIAALLHQLADPEEVIFAVTMRDVIAALVRRQGADAATLPVESLEMAREEVRAALQHHLQIEEYIAIGLDAWEIARNL